ncbi:MAG: hypothetical protein ABSE56_10230 [Bryobacteraceae bacterium]|jgi:hypothetical protein
MPGANAELLFGANIGSYEGAARIRLLNLGGAIGLLAALRRLRRRVS